MNTAIITGASSGIGREFVTQLANDGDIDEIWVIARREQRLNELKTEVDKPIYVLPLDLTDENALARYSDELKAKNPNVTLLVNCSGFGKFGGYDEIPISDSLDMIDLNCKALTYITEATVPYMGVGARIIELCSCSAFQPLPYMNVYAATKAYVLSYSRALFEELKPKKIHVLAVCPSWVKTEFIDSAKSTDSCAVKNFKNVYTADRVVRLALRDSKKFGKRISVCGLPTKLQHIGAKLYPTALCMRVWLRLQKMTRNS